MLDYVVYGKIIIDTIGLLDGGVVHGVLGGGGPQGAFGARLWSDSVGILTRTGMDIDPEPVKVLRDIKVDLQGWVKFTDLPTMRGGMFYDENEIMTSEKILLHEHEKETRRQNFIKMLARDIEIPAAYKKPKVIHLITEYPKEKMSLVAQEMRNNGTIFSLEPLIDFKNWVNREEMVAFLKYVDVATPDWPSASGIAGSEDPLEVMKFWSKLGPSLIAIRHGRFGSYTWDDIHDQFWHIPAVNVKPVDPTGAGNSYGGGLAVGWNLTKDARLAGCHGAVSAYFLVRQYSLPKMNIELQSEARDLLEMTIDSVESIE